MSKETTPEEEIKLIEGRIRDEYAKHKNNGDWPVIAARKIHSQWKEYWMNELKEASQQGEVEWMLCPKCNGEGKLLNEGGTSIHKLCDICNGSKMMPKFIKSLPLSNSGEITDEEINEMAFNLGYGLDLNSPKGTKDCHLAFIHGAMCVRDKSLSLPQPKLQEGETIPPDEEIENESEIYENQCCGEGEAPAFESGAKWMRDKLTGNQTKK